MSIKEKFEKIIGSPFRIFEDGELPEYIHAVGPTRLMALVDTDKLTKVNEYFPFKVTIPFKKGYLTYEKECFNVRLVKQAMEVLNPDEYGAYKEHIEEKNDEAWILVLKKGNYAIMIAPALKIEHTSDWPEVELKKAVKKVPSGVMVL